VTAIGNFSGDAIEQKLRVVPEGIARFISNSTIIVKDSNSTEVSAEISCAIPPTALNDTISVSASVVGDILGSTLNNLESLLQMSYGCGEQNMLNFVPNIVILKYLEATNKLTQAIRTTAVGYLEGGYQRQLQYLRSDGSFSAFGNNDPFGSTWLTAFVLKSFLLAQSYITVDMTVVQRNLDFLISKQNADGSFREDGRVIHSDMQGGSSSGTALTAYAVIVLTEVLSSFPQYEPQRDKALQNIIDSYNQNDVYSLGIISYALSLANHQSYSMIYFKFYSFAIETASELHWEKVKEADPSIYYYQPSSLDIEISAYALLSLYNKDISKSLKIIRWVVKQQSSLGGFKSTQDTVMALEALAKFAAQFKLTSSNLLLSLKPNVGNFISTSVNSSNSLVLQTFNLSPNVRKLGVQVSKMGTGLAVVSLSCNYYEIIEDLKPRFKIQHIFIDPCLGYLKSSICLSYISKSNDTSSNMVLLTFKLPSGFIYEERKVLNSAINVKNKSH
jgi:CD109 antigen